MSMAKLLFCLYSLVLVSCYYGNKSNKYLNSRNEFKDVEYLSNLTDLVCGKVREGETKRVAIKSKLFKKLNAKEIESIEECVVLKGAKIDTARDRITRNPYIYDSSLYVDFRVIRDADSAILSVWYPFGWDEGCGNGILFETYQLDKIDSMLAVGRKLKEGI